MSMTLGQLKEIIDREIQFGGGDREVLVSCVGVEEDTDIKLSHIDHSRTRFVIVSHSTDLIRWAAQPRYVWNYVCSVCSVCEEVDRGI